MDPHPTITIDHYNSSALSSTSTKIDRNEGHCSRSQQHHEQQKSPSFHSSSSQLFGNDNVGQNQPTQDTLDSTGTIFNHHNIHHSSPINQGKRKQSHSKVPVRQRSVSPPTTSSHLSLSVDPISARRNRRKSICAVLVVEPPSPTREDTSYSSPSNTHQLGNINNEGGILVNNMPDSSNYNRSTMEYVAASHHGGNNKHHHGGGGHRKHSSTTPRHSPNASQRGSKSNIASISSCLMDKIQQANLCMRRKSSPAISEQLSTVQLGSLRGSLALADALSSTTNNPADLSSNGKHRRSSKQTGYSGGSPVYMETSSGIVELRRKSHSNKGLLEDSRRLSSPSGLDKGNTTILDYEIEHIIFYLLYIY